LVSWTLFCKTKRIYQAEITGEIFKFCDDDLNCAVEKKFCGTIDEDFDPKNYKRLKKLWKKHLATDLHITELGNFDSLLKLKFEL
jgi:hypothetical protein